MKILQTLILISGIAAGGAFAAGPVVSNVTARITGFSENGKGMYSVNLEATYDLADADNDRCRIWPALRLADKNPVLADEGAYLVYKNVAGDTAVTPGTGYKITFSVTDTLGEYDFVRVKITAWDRQGWAPYPNLPFNPRNHAWALDVRNAPVHPRSTTYMPFIKSQETQPNYFLSVMVEFPVYPVMGNHAKAAPTCIATGYCSESDIVPMPFPHTSLGDPYDCYQEGYPLLTDGDRHICMIDVENWIGYGTYNSEKTANPQAWNIVASTRWDYTQETYTYMGIRMIAPPPPPDTVAGYRQLGWTSCDASGLDVTAGVVFMHEVEEGEIHHALRTTVTNSYAAFCYPATHYAGNTSNSSASPMGLRLRLKSSFNIDTQMPLQGSPGTDSFKASRAARVILRALQKYGMIVTDNAGTGWNSYLMAERDDHTAKKWADVWGTAYMSNTVPMDASIINNFYALGSAGLNSGLTWDDFEVVDWRWEFTQYSKFNAKK
jgi:hypothetical protein